MFRKSTDIQQITYRLSYPDLANNPERKRPTTATKFGDTLTSLLSEQPSTTTSDKPSKKTKTQPILSLSKAKLPPSKSKLALERKAEEAVKKAKVERVERARVTDVMEGWEQPGGSQEFERGLRKVAQRGGTSFLFFAPFFFSFHLDLVFHGGRRWSILDL